MSECCKKWFAQKVTALETPHLKEDSKTEILVRHYELTSLKSRQLNPPQDH